MKSIISFLLLLQSIINGVNYLVLALAPEKDTVYKCRDTGNYTDNTYQQNLISALNSLSSETGKTKGYYYPTRAGNPSQSPVYAFALCPINIKKEGCDDCVKKTISFLRQNCPKQKEAVAWALDCVIRYSDRTIWTVLDDWVWVASANPKTVGNVKAFDLSLNSLLDKITPKAAKGDPGLTYKYASDSTTYKVGNEVMTIYAAMQCTPDLTTDQCTRCLLVTKVMTYTCCSGKFAGRYSSPNCYMRYSHEKFI